MNVFISSASSPGDLATPSEDWFAATPDLIIVLDGATIRTETGCTHGAAWYAQQLGFGMLTWASGWGWPLRATLDRAIDSVARMHTIEGCDLSHPGTPSAAIGAVQITDDRLRYLVLGDVSIVIDTTSSGPVVVSDQRVSTTAAAERAEADRWPIGSDQKAAALLKMKPVELAARNVEGGYWIAAADPSAAKQAIVGEVPLDEVKRFAVLTDGAARYVDLFRLGDWAAVLRILESSGPDWFINHLVRPVEAADPLGVRYPRNKRSDDATAVYADLTATEDGHDRISVKTQAQLDAETAFLLRLSDPGLYGDGNMQKVAAERGASR